ncbi:MAG: hypothetical protein LC804_03205 [Acidobacteria bacterium]|nr:hypothetical protein [Acidobacteriota bacterium]
MTHMPAAAALLCTASLIAMQNRQRQAVQNSARQIVNAAPAPIGPYSHAVKAGGLIYVSGTLAQDASGEMVGKGDVAAQTRRVIERMRDVLTAAGSSLEQVVYPYSYAIRTGDTLFLSGLVSRNGKDNAIIPGDITTQTRAVMDNAGQLLKAAGMSYANVVSARVYLPDASVFQQMNEAYRSYFASVPPPARATVKAALAGSQYAVEITMIASSSRREPISDGRPANPNLSAAIRVGNRLYLSGMLGNTADNKGDVKAQTRETLARIRRTLEAAGYSATDVTDSIVYLTDLSAFAAMNDVYRGFFEGGFPARSTVGVGLVSPDAIVEIMMTAVKP